MNGLRVSLQAQRHRKDCSGRGQRSLDRKWKVFSNPLRSASAATRGAKWSFGGLGELVRGHGEDEADGVLRRSESGLQGSHP